MKKQLGIVLTALITTSMLAACNPGDMPGVDPSKPGIDTSEPAGSNSGTSATPSLSDTSDELKDSLTAVHADEDSFADADTLASEDAAFTTKQLRDLRDAADALRDPENRDRLENAVRTVRREARQRERIKDLRMKLFKAATAAQLKAAVQASGAVSVDADGVVTIDTQKLKAFTKEQLAKRKAMIESRLQDLKPKLQAKAEVAKAKLEKLRRKNVVARTSEVVTTENEDGTTTKTVEVEFTNERIGLTRNVVVSNTFDADGNLMYKDYHLMAKSKMHERTVVRTVEITEEGRKVTHESTTEWNNGRKREVSYERFIGTDGASSGVGTITITRPDGSTKVHEMTISSAADGSLETSASSEDGDADVVIAEDADGDATITEAEGEEETTQSDVDLDEEANAEAGDDSGDESGDDSDDESGDDSDDESGDDSDDEAGDEAGDDSGDESDEAAAE